ncbi:MAG: two-component system cell cycle response regulator DivK [Halieaceae bacterium]|jgi:two-component system cell cycle response regulator DivK
MNQVHRLLLVEDNELNRDMLRRRLERKGFAITTAVDGEEALTLMRAELPELVLLDMSLPVKDGWTTCREVRGDPDIKNIPIIALTAHAMNEDRERALAAGCDDYATKPINFPTLLDQIARLLPS